MLYRQMPNNNISCYSLKTGVSACLISAPLPHPSQASSNSWVYLSIWPKPRREATGLIQPWSRSQVSTLFNWSWEGWSTVVCKTRLSKKTHPRPAGQQGGEKKTFGWGSFIPCRPQHTGCLFYFFFSAGCIDPQPGAAQGLVKGRTQTCPRNGLIGLHKEGMWAAL